jgi:hypothetical protein
MRFQNNIRKGLIFAGIAAALALLPATVKAQEITNTEFNDGPNVVAMAQPTAAAYDTTSATDSLPATQAILATESIAASAEPVQASVTAPVPSTWVTFLLTLCVGLIALYTLIGADRASRSLGRYVSTRNA